MDEILHKENNTQNSNNISSFRNFYKIIIEFGEIVYPLILFYYCLFSYGSINLFLNQEHIKTPI
jgi:hypothetical protein